MMIVPAHFNRRKRKWNEPEGRLTSTHSQTRSSEKSEDLGHSFPADSSRLPRWAPSLRRCARTRPTRTRSSGRSSCNWRNSPKIRHAKNPCRGRQSSSGPFLNFTRVKYNLYRLFCEILRLAASLEFCTILFTISFANLSFLFLALFFSLYLLFSLFHYSIIL